MAPAAAAAAAFGVLDATFAAVASARAELRELGVRITLWANPAITRATYAERVTADYPLLAFDDMLVWCLVYLAIAAYGVFARSAFRARAKEAAAAAAARGGPVAAAAAPAAVAKKDATAAAAPWSWAVTSAKLARDPLKALMVVYNFVQVIVCGAMCVDVLLAVFAPSYYPERVLSPFCTGQSWRREQRSAVARVHWVFYVSKLLDFFDTIFIIARDKWDQFIFLHVYHHLSVFPVQWLFQAASPDGDTWWPVFANAFVHVVMVSKQQRRRRQQQRQQKQLRRQRRLRCCVESLGAARATHAPRPFLTHHLRPLPPPTPFLCARRSQYAYYGLSALDLKPSWGKYLTMLQITQFCTMIAHSLFLAINQPAPHTLLPAGLVPFTCDFPFWPAVVYGTYVFSLLALFLVFFEGKHGKSGKGAKKAE